MTPLLTYQIALGLTLLTHYLFGLVMGWLLWGVQAGLSGPLPGYQPGRVLRTTPMPERVLSPAQTRAYGKHQR